MLPHKFTLYNPYDNQMVTGFYVEVIAEALKRLGYETEKRNQLCYDAENDGIVIVHPMDYPKAKKCGYRHVFLWVQGIEPEESFMRHKSHLRKAVLSLKEAAGIRKSDLVFLVSEKMREFLEKKYHTSFSGRDFIMPCFNAELDEKSFFVPEKYENNIFTYTGSLAKWQCFEETVQLYGQIEKCLPGCRFDVYTGDKKEAEALLKKHGVVNYRIDFVPREELNKRLLDCKFGFVLREDTTVNRVATPTKFSTYMASGVIPVFSSCVDGFSVPQRI